jgi:hypothetical protein
VPAEPGRGKTFMGQETDVAPKRRGTAMVAIGIAVGVVVLGGGAFVAMQRMSPGAQASPPAPTTSLAAAATTTAAAATSAAGAAPAPTPTPTAAIAPTTVAVTVDAMPPGVLVFEGAQKIGTAPGPLSLAYGSDKVTLTFKADGYVPQNVDVVPTENRSLSVTLQKAPRQAAPAATKKDYEDPFKQ